MAFCCSYKRIYERIHPVSRIDVIEIVEERTYIVDVRERGEYEYFKHQAEDRESILTSHNFN